MVKRLALISGTVVFGDDIEQETEFIKNTMVSLEMCNLKVNVGKSFVRGYFRESCGMDAFGGHDITPVKQRSSLDDNDEVGMVKTIALHNHLVYKRSRLKRTIALLRTHILSKYKIGATVNHTVNPNCLLMSQTEAFDHNVKYNTFRWSRAKQAFELRSLVLEGIQYPLPSDRRWDLNYALFPKRGAISPEVNFVDTTKPSPTGSQIQFWEDNDMFRRLGLRPDDRPRVRLVPSWQSTTGFMSSQVAALCNNI
jgi:hypothetical protein